MPARGFGRMTDRSNAVRRRRSRHPAMLPEPNTTQHETLFVHQRCAFAAGEKSSARVGRAYPCWLPALCYSAWFQSAQKSKVCAKSVAWGCHSPQKIVRRVLENASSYRI